MDAHTRSQQQWMPQPGLQYSELLWDIFETRSQVVFEIEFTVQEAAEALQRSIFRHQQKYTSY